MVDRSDKADAKRFRWLLKGNGFYMEQNSLCGNWEPNEEDHDDARKMIDREIRHDKYDAEDKM
jgi:hypothetical protein